MANLYYDPIESKTKLQVYKDPQIKTKTDMEDDRDTLQSIQGLSDAFRGDIAQSGLASLGIPGGFGSLQDFDDFVEAELDRILDELDYFDYEVNTANLNIVDFDWFLPEALETPLPADNGTDVVANCIDAQGGGSPDPNDPLNTTYWQLEVAGARALIVRLRGYTKRCEGIRLRTNAGDTRAQLQGLTVKAANSLANIDDVANTVATGVNLDDTNAWYEVSFVKPKCRYLKLEFSTSAHTNPDITRIRSLQVKVGITNHDK